MERSPSASIPYYTFDWTYRYVCVGGASVPGREELRGDALKLALFLEFHELVVRDGVDPQRAHEAFLVIDEYAEAIAPDVRDARRPSFRGTGTPEIRRKGRLERRNSHYASERWMSSSPTIRSTGSAPGPQSERAKYANASRDDFEKEMVWHIYKEMTGEGGYSLTSANRSRRCTGCGTRSLTSRPSRRDLLLNGTAGPGRRTRLAKCKGFVSGT